VFQYELMVYMCSKCPRVHSSAEKCLSHERGECPANAPSSSATQSPPVEPPFTIVDDHDADVKPANVHAATPTSAVQLADEEKPATSSSARSPEPARRVLSARAIDTHARRYECVQCGRSFHRRQHCAQHVLTHSSARTYACKVCEKTFRQRSTLDSHKLTHSSARTYACQVCEKTFRQRSTLSSHKLTHTRGSPHACAVCAKTFQWRKSVDRHMQLAHTTVACDECYYQPTGAADLRRHKMSYHPMMRRTR